MLPDARKLKGDAPGASTVGSKRVLGSTPGFLRQRARYIRGSERLEFFLKSRNGSSCGNLIHRYASNCSNTKR